MNNPSSPSDERWDRLIRQARADLGPPIDEVALQRVVRQAALPARPGWGGEFASLFSLGRLIPACLAGAAACALLASWQVWETWQALPWADLLSTATGGSS